MFLSLVSSASDPDEVCSSFRSGCIVSSLSVSLQNGIRFFIHPLPSKVFRLCYLRPTINFRPSIDFVGFTLLYRLVFCLSLGIIFSAMGVVFIRFNKAVMLNLPIYLLVSACQPDLALCTVTQFKYDNSLSFAIERLPFALCDRFRLAVEGYFCGLHSVCFVTYLDVTRLI
jgi:hypothetical protein